MMNWNISIFLTSFSLSLLSTAVAPAAPAEGLPPTLERIGQTSAVPNEYPGHIYAFNWCLNSDGVTPVNKKAFRITKPLDLKVAGIPVPKKNPLQVSLGTFLLGVSVVGWYLVFGHSSCFICTLLLFFSHIFFIYIVNALASSC
jgi:hypothetical protein